MVVVVYARAWLRWWSLVSEERAEEGESCGRELRGREIQEERETERNHRPACLDPELATLGHHLECGLHGRETRGVLAARRMKEEVLHVDNHQR